jgi:hypothetical protein
VTFNEPHFYLAICTFGSSFVIALAPFSKNSQISRGGQSYFKK